MSTHALFAFSFALWFFHSHFLHIFVTCRWQVPSVPTWLKERIAALGAEVDQAEHSGSPDSKGVLASVDTHRKTRRNNSSNFGAVSPLRRDEVNAALKASLDDQQASSPDMQSVRNALPIASLRGELLATLEQSPVVVVSGGTGSGKTTQIPQYILDEAIESGRGCDVNVITTAPHSLLPRPFRAHTHTHTRTITHAQDSHL